MHPWCCTFKFAVSFTSSVSFWMELVMHVTITAECTVVDVLPV